ncbi:MAG: DinB family protein [Planctomycetota bacterium]|nr:DinB family protein [Planctomycetota bacterium]
MLTTIKELLANQYEAALCTLNQCIEHCPDAIWNAPVARHPFCQVAFHTLFFADYYLGKHEEAFRDEAYHRENAELFGDYEQLQTREPTSLYERQAIKAYLNYCRTRAVAVLDAETSTFLEVPCNFPRKSFTRAELHVYNIRHVQHHAAQLILRLRLDSQVDIPWVGSAWREF